MDFSDLGGQEIRKQPGRGIDFSDLGGQPIQQQQPDQQPSTFDRINNSFPMARKGLQIGLEALNVPFELAGEAVRAPLAQLPNMMKNGVNAPADDGFRAPALVQRMFPSTRTEKPPTPFYELPRRLLKGGFNAAINPQNSEAAASSGFNSNQPLDPLTDIGFSVGMPKTMGAPAVATEKIIGGVAKPLFRGIGAGIKAGAAGLTGVPLEDVNARLANPELLKNARSPEKIAEGLPRTMERLSGDISQASKVADDALSSQPLESKSQLQSHIDSLKRKIGTPVGMADKKAISVLDDISKDLGQFPENVSQKQIKTLVQKLDSSINKSWQQQPADVAAGDKALQNLRISWDHYLKDVNPEYQEAMKPVAQKTRLFRKVGKEFRLNKEPGQPLSETNTTISKIKNAPQDKNKITQQLLEELRKHTGEDILGESKAYKQNQSFMPFDRSRGSKRTLLGATIGAAIGQIVGHPIAGANLGAEAGFATDLVGGFGLGKAIDAYVAVKRSIPNLTMAEFVPELKMALREKGISLDSAAPVANELGNEIPNFTATTNETGKPKPKPLFRKAS